MFIILIFRYSKVDNIVYINITKIILNFEMFWTF